MEQSQDLNSTQDEEEGGESYFLDRFQEAVCKHCSVASLKLLGFFGFEIISKCKHCGRITSFTFNNSSKGVKVVSYVG